MRALSGQELIRIWEMGQGLHPIDRALTMLSAAFPGKSRDELARLSIGQRDGHLLALRERTCGPTLPILAECPQCKEGLEFDLEVGDIRVAPEDEGDRQVFDLTVGEFALQFRLPNSVDLAAMVRCEDADKAGRLLVQRCVLHACRGEDAVSPNALPETCIEKLAASLTEADPQAEVQLNLACPSCEHRWEMVFDIVSFFWLEISAQARRLLREAHTLARYYGWREADILSMSPARRQFYLEMATHA